MLDHATVLHLAEAFRDCWLSQGGAELAAVLDVDQRNVDPLPAVFIAGSPVPSFAEAKTTAAKALNAASWTTAHTVGAGVLFPKGIQTFSTDPPFIIAQANTFTYLCFYNAAWVMNITENKYTEMTIRATAELAKWTQAAQDPYALFNLQLNTANRLSYELTDLELSETQRTIRTMMQTMGI